MPSTPGQHLMPTLCASAPSRHPQAALLRRRRPSPPTIVRSGAALLRVHAVVADHRPAGCWRAKHRRAALPSSNSSETEAAVLGAAVPRQDYRQRRRCLLGSLARSQLASGRWWPAFTTSRGDGISFTVRAGLILSRPMGSVRLGMDGPGVLELGAVGLGLHQMTAQFSQPICLREARSLLPCRVPLRRDRPGCSPPASSWRG